MPSWTIQNFPEDRMMLHLSYHDGNHFNSVRESTTGRPASRSECEAIPSPPLIKQVSSPRTVKAGEQGLPQAKEKSVIRVVLIVLDNPSEPVKVTFIFKRTKEKLNNIPSSSRDMCPCGSQKRYKKCCKKRHTRCNTQNKISEQDNGPLDCSNIYV